METIGFIGLGVMGRPMALNLLKAGYPLVVHNRSHGAVEALVKNAATEAANPREVAAKCDVVITMLPDSPAVEQVVTASNGIFAGAHAGLLLIDMSTSSPALARRLARVGKALSVEVLDAPVSGGDVGAANATLSIMVGGKESAFDRARPVLQALGKNIVYMGEAGAGQVTKAANQIVVGLTIEAVAEALVLAAKAGVDPARVRRALLGGFAQSRVLDLHGQRMLDRNFAPGARVRTHRKDLSIALEVARENTTPLPLTAQLFEMFSALSASGHDDLDHSSLVTLIESLANSTIVDAKVGAPSG